MAYAQVLLFLQLVLMSSAIISDDVKSLIYTLQTKYCGRSLCSKNTSHTPPVCLYPVTLRRKTVGGTTVVTDLNTTVENYTLDSSSVFNMKTSRGITTISPQTSSPESAPASEYFEHILTREILQPCEPCFKCSCHDSCEVFGDCCADKEIGGKYFFDCEFIKNYFGRGAYSDFILTVTKCLQDAPSYTEDLAEKCEHGELGYVQDGRLVTAPHPFNTSVTFRNKYCAACYDVNNYTPWDVYINCREDFDSSNYTDINSLIRSAGEIHCSISTNIKNKDYYNTCFLGRKMVSTCNVTGLWQEYNKSIEEACHSYYNPTRMYYKNIFCHLCNGEPEQELKCPSECHIHKVAEFSVTSFAALLNFENSDAEVVLSPWGQEGIYQSIKRFGDQTHAQCRDGDIYDSCSKRCRETYCPLSDRRDNSACIQLVPDEHLILSIWNATLSFNEGVNILPFNPPTFRFPFSQNTNIQNLLSEYGFFIYEMAANSYARIKNADNLVVDEVHLWFTILLMPNYTLASSRERLAALQNVTLNITVGGTTLEVEIQSVTTHRNVQDKLMLPQTMFIQMFPPSMHLDMSLRINVPLAFNMTCSMAEFGSHEVIRVNQSVFIHGDIELNGHEYFTSKHGTYFICLDAVFRRRKEIVVQMPAFTAPAFASKITTAVCLSLSIIFLLLTLMVYILIKELHTVPGLNLILLSSSLFLAHVLYLFGAGTVSTPTICTVIGVLIHYFWLASFAWMNVCCLHMFRVFTNLFSSLHFADHKVSLMIKYSVFAYGVPLVIVTMTLTITYIQSGYTTVGYGGPALCFVAPGLVSLVFFGGPACLTVVINGVLFLWTMVSIRLKNNRQSESLGKKQANDVITFFKLSTITGLSWLFGFVGYILQRVELMYVFTVLTAGQGVFIFLSFVVSRRILKLIRDHLRCMWPKKESTATGASMTNSYQGKETRM
ncbi:uncharacterized protein [Haliotis cracherodii]|uniref:uncharacterized protein n=1 Tax=Haliotis cracherodii TaxID=6455 RepID=UPI0039EC4B32